MRNRVRVVSICVSLVWTIILASSTGSVTDKYIKDFATNQYCDLLNTTAWWDTLAGELKLYPFQITSAGSYYTPDMSLCVAIDGNYAYVAGYNLGLQVVDITDPTNPALAGSYDTPGYARAVAVAGNYAYVGDGELGGLQVIYITDPTNPVLAGSYDNLEGALCVGISGDYAYVADDQTGLQVIDIGDPTAPRLAGSYDTGFLTSTDVTIAGNYEYLAQEIEGFEVIDISDPTVPILARSYNTPDRAVEVAIAGDFAYVADLYSGLQVIDISDPTAPTLAGNYDTPHLARGIAFAGDYAYVADDSSGLQIIQVFERTCDLEHNTAQSRTLYASGIIDKVKLIPTQADSILWEVSADGGTYWQDIPDTLWNDLDYSGDELMWKATLLHAQGGVYPSCSSLEIQLDGVQVAVLITFLHKIPHYRNHEYPAIAFGRRFEQTTNDAIAS